MKTIGFVYILTNEAMPGLCKVGMTMRSPHARALELSAATGVPQPFDVAYYCEVENPAEQERRIHAEFDHLRIGSNREFFRCEPEALIPSLRDNKSKAWSEYGFWSEYLGTNRLRVLQHQGRIDDPQRMPPVEPAPGVH